MKQNNEIENFSGLEAGAVFAWVFRDGGYYIGMHPEPGRVYTALCEALYAERGRWVPERVREAYTCLQRVPVFRELATFPDGTEYPARMATVRRFLRKYVQETGADACLRPLSELLGGRSARKFLAGCKKAVWWSVKAKASNPRDEYRAALTPPEMLKAQNIDHFDNGPGRRTPTNAQRRSGFYGLEPGYIYTWIFPDDRFYIGVSAKPRALYNKLIKGLKSGDTEGLPMAVTKHAAQLSRDAGEVILPELRVSRAGLGGLFSVTMEAVQRMYMERVARFGMNAPLRAAGEILPAGALVTEFTERCRRAWEAWTSKYQ